MQFWPSCLHDDINNSYTNRFNGHFSSEADLVGCLLISKHCQTSTTVDTAGSQEQTATKEHVEKKIWRKKWAQQVSVTAEGRWRRQHKTELDGDKLTVAYAPGLNQVVPRFPFQFVPKLCLLLQAKTFHIILALSNLVFLGCLLYTVHFL